VSREPPRGRFITLEGGEGAGKSTQIARLADALTRLGIKVRTTREPGGSPAAESIRKLLVEGEPGRWRPLTEALLHFAARKEHLDTVIRPALEAGEWVISDRFADSTMAYQGYGHQLGPEPIAALYKLAVGSFAPDLTVILDVPVDAGLVRAAGRNHSETRYERMDRTFHERVRQGFLQIAAGDSSRCVVVDATGNLEEVTARIFAAVADRLKIPVKA
jgi:dTMP kinase